MMANSSSHACSHSSATTPFHQTIDELEFERGIWTAAINNDIDRLRLLISRDAGNVNKPDNHGYTALHYAARAGHVDVCRMLLESGGDVNAKLKSGDTALHRASYMGREDVVQLLIKYQAESCQGADGLTPLHKAVQQRHSNVAKMLIERYPNLLQLADNAGRLPSDLCKQSDNEDNSWWNKLFDKSPV